MVAGNITATKEFTTIERHRIDFGMVNESAIGHVRPVGRALPYGDRHAYLDRPDHRSDRAVREIISEATPWGGTGKLFVPR